MMSQIDRGPFHPGSLRQLQPVNKWLPGFAGPHKSLSSCFKAPVLKMASVSAADVMLVQPRVEFILSFIHHIAEDEDHSDGVVANSAGLIG